MSDVFPEYDYELPEELIAHNPAAERDKARLFVYDTATDTIRFDTFEHLATYLPEGALMVLNETKVLPARVRARTSRGTETELLFLLNEKAAEEGSVYALSPKKLREGERLSAGRYDIEVQAYANGRYTLGVGNTEEFLDFLKTHGEVPTPPYITTTLNANDLQERYQTIFAKNGASVAAPTASLHFTDNVFASLDTKRIECVKIRLDVGLGTFAKVTEDQLAKNQLHVEPYAIPKATVRDIQDAKNAAVPLIAVGTTVTRTLESAAESILSGQKADGAIEGSTTLFIKPGFEFNIADILITNFHVPRSSLMSLVDAFLVHKGSKRRILDLYTEAMKEGFRFYSFGDSMLIL